MCVMNCRTTFFQSHPKCFFLFLISVGGEKHSSGYQEGEMPWDKVGIYWSQIYTKRRWVIFLQKLNVSKQYIKNLISNAGLFSSSYSRVAQYTKTFLEDNWPIIPNYLKNTNNETRRSLWINIWSLKFLLILYIR